MMLHAKTAEEENFNWVADQIKAMGHKRKKINYHFGPLAKISTANFSRMETVPETGQRRITVWRPSLLCIYYWHNKYHWLLTLLYVPVC